jgi:hypothetical protein
MYDDEIPVTFSSTKHKTVAIATPRYRMKRIHIMTQHLQSSHANVNGP